MSKILIVEDDISIQALLHDFIQERKPIPKRAFRQKRKQRSMKQR